MTPTRPRVALCLAAIMLGAPSQASDFSFMSKPSFARMLLLSPERLRQADCAGLALYRSRTGQSPGKAAAERLASDVGKRIGVDVGDPSFATEMVEGRASGFADPLKTEPVWAEVRDYLASKCAPLFAAAEKGGAELAAALGPVPSAPLPLPEPEQCLAVTLYAKEVGQAAPWEEVGDAVRHAWIEAADPSERTAREASVAAGLAHIHAKKPTAEEVDLLVMSCVPTMIETVKASGVEPALQPEG